MGLELVTIWGGGYRKYGVPNFRLLIIRIVLCRVLYLGPPIFGNSGYGVLTWIRLQLLVLTVLTVVLRIWLGV